MKIKIIMCEGSHDVTFLLKILLTRGYTRAKSEFSKFPGALRKIFENSFKKCYSGDKLLNRNNNSYYLPEIALKKGDDEWVLIHAMQGDKTISERHTIIGIYSSLIHPVVTRTQKTLYDISFYLFYDADDFGVTERIKKVNEDFKDKYIFSRELTANGEITDAGITFEEGGSTPAPTKFGVYIFHDPDSPELTGTLENQLLKLINNDNSDLVNKAKSFLTENEHADTDRTKEYDAAKDCYRGGSNFYPDKSIISVCGQLSFSGSNLALIIGKSDLIKKKHINSDNECQKIADMLTL